MNLPAGALRLILVVDDDERVRAFLSEALKRSGYGVWEAPSTKLAVKILSERRINLVIGDATRLEQDGGLRRLRHAQPGIKILAMTGAFPAISTAPRFVRRRVRFSLMDPAGLKARLFLGADGTLPKPVSADLLIETTRKLLGETPEVDPPGAS